MKILALVLLRLLISLPLYAMEQQEKAKCLWEAIRTGNIEEVRQQLDNAEQGGTLQQLLEAREKIFGRTALMLAAEQGCEEIVKMLLQKRHESGVLKLLLEAQHKSVTEKHTEKAFEGYKYIANNLLKINQLLAKDNSGVTILFFPVANGHEGVLNILLQEAENFNILPQLLLAQNKADGGTVLRLAGARGHEQMTKLLMPKAEDHGCLRQLLEATDKSGCIALGEIAASGRVNTGLLFLQAAEKYKILQDQLKQYGLQILKTAMGHKEFFDLILQEAERYGLLKQLLQQRDENGETLVIHAAYHRSIYFVNSLLTKAKQYGILKEQLQIKDNKGRTALTAAQHMKNENVIQLLQVI